MDIIIIEDTHVEGANMTDGSKTVLMPYDKKENNVYDVAVKDAEGLIEKGLAIEATPAEMRRRSGRPETMEERKDRLTKELADVNSLITEEKKANDNAKRIAISQKKTDSATKKKAKK